MKTTRENGARNTTDADRNLTAILRAKRSEKKKKTNLNIKKKSANSSHGSNDGRVHQRVASSDGDFRLRSRTGRDVPKIILRACNVVVKCICAAEVVVETRARARAQVGRIRLIIIIIIIYRGGGGVPGDKNNRGRVPRPRARARIHFSR